jgi:hypothetical protein
VTAQELETWARQHLTTAIETRRRVTEFNPICVTTTGTDDKLHLLLIPKADVPAAIATIVREHPGAVAVAMVMDTWVAEKPRSDPPPYDRPVREMPGRSDAMVVLAKSRSAECLIIARYVEVGRALRVDEPEMMGSDIQSAFFKLVEWPKDNV